MRDRPPFLITLLVSLFLHSAYSQDNDAAIKMSPSPSTVVQPSSSVSLTCTLDVSRLGSHDAIWQKRQGSLVTRIAYNSFLDKEFSVDGQRYIMSRSDSGTKYTYTLDIRDVKYEDSGTIECVFSLSNNNRKSSMVLAVCDNKDSASCKCMLETGWASPHCFKEPDDWVKKNQGYKNAVVALAVVLAITIAVGILMALLAGKDCMAKAMEKQKKAAERRALAAQTNNVMIPTQHPYSDRQQLTMDINDSASDIVMPPQNDYIADQRKYTTIDEEPRQPAPRQKGRRAERAQQEADVREADDDRCSDSGMSSTNASSVSAQVHHHADHDPRGNHQHQDSSSSSSSHGGARPKNTVYKVKGSPPPSYKNLPDAHRGEQETSLSYGAPQQQRNMYGAHDDLSAAGYGATPYRPNQAPVTPRSVQSEHYSPAEHQRPPPRGAYTDVRPPQSRQSEPRPAQHYTDPRKLDFNDQQQQGNTQDNNNHTSGAYIDQGSTVI